MSVNTLSFQQAAAILNELNEQVTGQKAIAPVDLSEYISVGQKTLLTGYDPLSIGVSQMVGRTIFSYRPYESPLSILRNTSEEYGAITRKISPIQQVLEEDGTYSLTDGRHEPDMFSVRKPKLYQTNFYGFDVWDSHVTVPRQQLKNAVLNPADMGRLLDLVLGTKANEMELSRETFERATLANAIAATVQLANPRQVRHLLTEYNAATGLNLTAEQARQPQNYGPFVKWAYAQIAKVSDLLRAYSSAFHLNPTEGNILRHTPKDAQRVFVYSGALHEIDANVLASTFNASMVKEQLPVTASIDFFQSLQSPDSVSVTPAYVGANGAVAEGTPQEVNNIFAVIADRDALGTNYHDQSVDVTPMESAGKYFNYWYHEARRYWFDAFENMVVFLMD